MGWNAGTYTKGNSATGGWAGDASLGIGIEAGRHDTQDNDFETGINSCLNKDGSNSCTGNLNLGGYKPVNLASGTAAAPAICAGNDVNTGIFSAASDQIGISTNGTERVRIDSTGQVGIGTTTPKEQLQISSTASFSSKDSGGSSGNTLGFNYYYSSGTKAITTGNRTVTVELGNAGGYLKSTTATQTADAALTGMNTYMQWGGFDNDIKLSTNNAERIRIDSAGNVGIGTTGPTSSLVVAGGVQTVPTVAGVHLGADAGYSVLNLANSTGGYLDFGPVSTDWSGRIIFNNSTNAFQIIAVSAGVQLASGGTSWASLSDERFKKNVQPLEYGLSELCSLAPVRFDYVEEKSEASARIGFIAQQVKGTIPEAISGNEEDRLFLSQTEIIPVLVSAIKELNAKVESLEARLAELES